MKLELGNWIGVWSLAALEDLFKVFNLSVKSPDVSRPGRRLGGNRKVLELALAQVAHQRAKSVKIWFLLLNHVGKCQRDDVLCCVFLFEACVQI